MNPVSSLQMPMAMAAQTPQVQSGSCGMEPAPSPWLKRIELVCRVALGVFAAYIAPLYFAISFSIGILIGAAYQIVVAIKNKTLLGAGEARPVCAQGFMEYLSGMKFAPEIAAVVTAVFIGDHVHHRPGFYVPFCGVFVGFWGGTQLTSALIGMGNRAASWIKAKPAPAPSGCCCH